MRFYSLVLIPILARMTQAQEQAPIPRSTMVPETGRGPVAALSPMTDYMASAVGYVIIIAFLVAILLIGGFLIVNLGMLSKRRKDRVGGRTPSDVGVLKGSNWPSVPEDRLRLPAQDDGEGLNLKLNDTSITGIPPGVEEELSQQSRNIEEDSVTSVGEPLDANKKRWAA